MEKTLGIIKPNLVQKKVAGKIISLLEENGFHLAGLKLSHLTKSQAEEFYIEHRERPFYSSLVSFMTSGPVILIALEGENAIAKYRKLMGATNPSEAAPGTIRKLFGEDIEKNGVHGSDSVSSAAREVKFFFPELV